MNLVGTSLVPCVLEIVNETIDVGDVAFIVVRSDVSTDELLEKAFIDYRGFDNYRKYLDVAKILRDNGMLYMSCSADKDSAPYEKLWFCLSEYTGGEPADSAPPPPLEGRSPHTTPPAPFDDLHEIASSGSFLDFLSKIIADPEGFSGEEKRIDTPFGPAVVRTLSNPGWGITTNTRVPLDNVTTPASGLYPRQKPTITPAIGKMFLNRVDELVIIESDVKIGTPEYAGGYRFRCNRGRLYQKDGSFIRGKESHNHDLVKELIVKD